MTAEEAAERGITRALAYMLGCPAGSIDQFRARAWATTTTGGIRAYGDGYEVTLRAARHLRGRVPAITVVVLREGGGDLVYRSTRSLPGVDPGDVFTGTLAVIRRVSDSVLADPAESISVAFSRAWAHQNA